MNLLFDQMLYEYAKCTTLEEQGLWTEKWIAPIIRYFVDINCELTEEKKKELQVFMKRRMK